MITHYQLSIMTCRVIYKSKTGEYKVLLLENRGDIGEYVLGEFSPIQLADDINIHSYCSTLNKT